MASLHTAVIILLSLLFLSLSTAHYDVHDILSKYGFPKGLIPNAVKSYSLSRDGSFVINLNCSCYVPFDEVVYYYKNITGKITQGSLSDLSGIKIKKLFIWVSVTQIQVDSGSGMIEFYVGSMPDKFHVKQFQNIPSCMNKASPESLSS